MNFKDSNFSHGITYPLAGILLFVILAFFLIRLTLKNKKEKPSDKEKPLFLPKEKFAASIKALFLTSGKKIEEIVPELEEVLLAADVGVKGTEALIGRVLEDKNIDSRQKALGHLKSEILKILTPKTEFYVERSRKPHVIYLVGVNGVGKTTTIGKLAHQFKREGLSVMLVAADTFRAAALEQLAQWAKRNEAAVTGGKPGADPASVIVDALRSARAKKIDVVLVDTAGRLQTKKNLMEELKKMVRMCQRELGRDPDEIFLVLDAVTGQNGFNQTRVFFDAVPLSGIILTKYDATAKGGIIISVVKETGLPIRFLGMGEKIDDLKKFDPELFVEGLFG